MGKSGSCESKYLELPPNDSWGFSLDPIGPLFLAQRTCKQGDLHLSAAGKWRLCQKISNMPLLAAVGFPPSFPSPAQKDTLKAQPRLSSATQKTACPQSDAHQISRVNQHVDGVYKEYASFMFRIGTCLGTMEKHGREDRTRVPDSFSVVYFSLRNPPNQKRNVKKGTNYSAQLSVTLEKREPFFGEDNFSGAATKK